MRQTNIKTFPNPRWQYSNNYIQPKEEKEDTESRDGGLWSGG